MAPTSSSREPWLSAMREKWRSDIPVLYDWLMSHNTLWPSLSCRWGSVVSDQTHHIEQRVILSEQTDGSAPNTILIANATIPKQHVASSKHLLDFEEEFDSPFITNSKSIAHLGEVNRIREFPRFDQIIATHSDSPNVYIWNTISQPNQKIISEKNPKPTPDLVLVGHKENAEFALSTNSDNLVLSGGKDKLVVLWNLEDHVTSLQSKTMDSGSQLSTNYTQVECRGTFKGHKNNVEDVQFNPLSKDEFCSVGDDKLLLFYDSRSSNEAVAIVETAHGSDVHCLDWNILDENLVLTGSADLTVNLYDRRNLKSAVCGFKGHSESVTCVQWCPNKKSVFGSSGEDGIINIWDFSESPSDRNSKNTKSELPSNSTTPLNVTTPRGLIFRHIGHRNRISEFQWNSRNPWTVLSTSLNEGKLGGGILQIWRVNEFVWNEDYTFHVEGQSNQHP